MKKFFLFFFTVILLSGKAQAPAGSYKDYFREGNYLLLEENYEMALRNFLKAYELDSSSCNINYNVGLCYLKSLTHKADAEAKLAKAVKSISKHYKMDDHTEKDAPPLAIFYYAQALHINYKFDEGLEQYNKFLVFVEDDKDWKKEIEYYKRQTVYAKELIANPINVQISNMGDSINSEWPDFSPVLSADERTMIYTTRRPTGTGGEKTPEGQYFEDIVVSYKDDNGKWSKPVSLSEYVNTNGHEASVSLSPDGQTLIVFRDDAGNGNIYFTQWDGKTWGGIQSFGSDINTKYWEPHACLNVDGTVLYFTSDRPGGKGGRDIYRSVKLPNGKWSKAQNLGGSVNTEYDEDSPFMHPDGKMFFFASKGHKTMGGFDLMYSIIDEEGKFSEPINLGHPINTPDDDVFYSTSPDGKRAYFSSAKDGGFGEKDIYLITIQGVTEKALALFKGQIVPAEGETLPEDLIIIVTDKLTGENIGTYRPKMANGTFAVILPPGKEYNFSYQAPRGEEFYNEDIYVTNELTYQEIKKEINLEPIKLLGKIKVRDKGILLNVTALNNAKDKKGMEGATITITDKDGKIQTFSTNEKGKKDGIALQPENTYQIVIELGGKKAEATLSTKGLKGSKSVSQILYLDGKTKTSAYTLSLDVTVLTKNGKKPVANANVVLVGSDNNKYEGVTDNKGELKGVPLDADISYNLSAKAGENASEKATFTTNNIKADKVFKKTLYVESVATSDKPLTVNKYEYYFTYNKNKLDSAQDVWNAFINKLVMVSNKKTVTVAIEASASKVPTMISFKNNKELAASRATKTRDKIIEAVAAAGGNTKRLKFTLHSSVGGPRWRNDHIERRQVFEKFQYVKARIVQ